MIMFIMLNVYKLFMCLEYKNVIVGTFHYILIYEVILTIIQAADI